MYGTVLHGKNVTAFERVLGGVCWVFIIDVSFVIPADNVVGRAAQRLFGCVVVVDCGGQGHALRRVSAAICSSTPHSTGVGLYDF